MGNRFAEASKDQQADGKGVALCANQNLLLLLLLPAAQALLYKCFCVVVLPIKELKYSKAHCIHHGLHMAHCLTTVK